MHEFRNFTKKNMKLNFTIPKFDAKAMSSFAKEDVIRQSEILKENGIMLDRDSENDKTINLYFLKGFFVEEIISRAENKILDILPFKRGYKVEKFLKDKGILEIQ